MTKKVRWDYKGRRSIPEDVYAIRRVLQAFGASPHELARIEKKIKRLEMLKVKAVK